MLHVYLHVHSNLHCIEDQQLIMHSLGIEPKTSASFMTNTGFPPSYLYRCASSQDVMSSICPDTCHVTGTRKQSCRFCLCLIGSGVAPAVSWIYSFMESDSHLWIYPLKDALANKTLDLSFRMKDLSKRSHEYLLKALLYIHVYAFGCYSVTCIAFEVNI